MWLWFVLACGAPKESAAPPPADADADTDADADADTDTDTDTDTDADLEPIAGPCPHYFGFQEVGQWRSYVSTPDWEATTGQQGSWTTTATVLTPDGSEVVLTTETELVIPGFDWYRYVSTVTWRCSSEGARLLAYTADYDWSLSGTLSEGWVDSVYEGGALMWPPEVGPGDTWVAETIVTTTSSWAEPSTLKSAVSFEAVEASSTTVPAGTYDSLTVEQSSGGPWVPFYVHPTLGTLADDFGQLTGSG